MDGYQPIAINARIETADVLGPLPEKWEIAPWGNKNRVLFVDHESKTTSWIDPRTFALRKHDVREVVPGELPYGWEEAFDDVCGIYYIDHISRRNFLEGPWDSQVREQVLALHGKLEQEARLLEEQMNLENRKKEELAAAQAKMNKLDAARRKLEKDLAAMARSGDDAEGERLRAELEAIQSQLEQEQVEFEHASEEHANIQNEIQEFQKRLYELQVVNERLENENVELAAQTVATQKNLEEMRNMIELEAKQRSALENYIKQLKNEVIEMYDPERAEQIRSQEDQTDAEYETVPLPLHGTDADAELFALQSRLQEERAERERLKELTETLEAERNKIQEDILNEEPQSSGLPEWIINLNINAQKSKTLRKKIAKENPDNLKFKDKVLKFTAAAIDASEKPKVPENQGQKKSDKKAVKGKETAYASSPLKEGGRQRGQSDAPNPSKVVDLTDNIEQNYNVSENDLEVQSPALDKSFR